jgi:hypothetical protein
MIYTGMMPGYPILNGHAAYVLLILLELTGCYLKIKILIW